MSTHRSYNPQKEDPIKDEIKARVSIRELAFCDASGRTSCPYADCSGYRSRDTQVSDDFWFCHVCKRGGDVFEWTMLTDNVNYGVARRTLAERLGIPLSPNKERMKLLRQVVIAAHLYLFDEHPEKLAYLEQRGIPSKTAFKFQIGYIDPEGQALEMSGVNKEDLLKLGLYYPARIVGEEDLSVMAGRYIFPIRDLYGRLVQLKGRADPKVLSEEARKSIPLQKKPPRAPDNWGTCSHLSYLYLEETLAKKRDYVIIAEGEPDTLTLQTLGFKAVGLQTSQGMGKHAHKLKGIPDIYLMLDNDVASQRMITQELYDLQLRLPESRVHRVLIPNLLGNKEDGRPIKVDVNDYVAKLGKSKKDIQKLLQASELGLEIVIRDWGQDLSNREQFTKLSRLLCNVTGPEKTRLLKLFSEVSGKAPELLAFAIDPAGLYEV